MFPASQIKSPHVEPSPKYVLNSARQSSPVIPGAQVIPESQQDPIPDIQTEIESEVTQFTPSPWKYPLQAVSVVSEHPPIPSQQAPIPFLVLKQLKSSHVFFTVVNLFHLKDRLFSSAKVAH